MNNTVLLVDDDANLLEALERQLHGEPYRIITAGSGQEALGVLSDTPVDVVVSDQEMPGMKGTQFLWQVKKSFPDTILFMLTGRATLAANEIGISRFFIKPCNGLDLALSIRQSLQYSVLATHAQQLLLKVKQQSAILGHLERELPGTIQADLENSGADLPHEKISTDHKTLIEEIQRVLGESIGGGAPRPAPSGAPDAGGVAPTPASKESGIE